MTFGKRSKPLLHPVKPLRSLAICAAFLTCAVAGSEPSSTASRQEAAQIAGIETQLVVDPSRRTELVRALERRILQGVFEENAFRIELTKRNSSKIEYAELRRSYLDTRAKGFDHALLLASELGCVELIPLLIKQGDMRVLNFGAIFQKGEDAPAVRAIVAMGLKAAKPLFDVVEQSPNAQERYYALSALQLGKTAWKDELGSKGLAELMAAQCDTTKPAVQLALALLKGNIHDPKTAAGEDLEQR